jgi:hypothetical protein
VPSKKDFSGKSKTTKTYDKDWVFVKDKHTTGPNQSAGAWMTIDQRRDLHDEQTAARMARDAKAAPPGPPGGATPTTTAAILGTNPIVEASTTSAAMPPPPPNPDTAVPSWWINQAIVNPANPDQQFANAANALLPTLAPEDQRTLATYLATNFKDVYGGYGDVNFGVAPTEMTDAIRKQYLSPQRAQMATSLLDRMKTASGATDMGAGYDFLKNAVNLINQFSTEGVLTRERYNQFTSALSGLTGQAGKDLSAYANLAQLFNLPNFSAGPLISNTPNTKLYG